MTIYNSIENSIICCICLDTENLTNLNHNIHITECCKNKLHKDCLIHWFLYVGAFSCPMCRNSEYRIPLNELLYFNITTEHSNDTKVLLLKNLNNLINTYNIPYSIVIDIPNIHSIPNNINNLSYNISNYFTCTSIRIRPHRYIYNILLIIFIPIFYIMILYLLPQIHEHWGEEDLT